ncbi:MAG: biopolymer transporter ExbD [Puniceicoccaceae bacterium]
MKHRSKMLQADRRLTAVTTINMTPLIDLAFALLIIFIIATPLLEQTIPLHLPLENANPGSTRDEVVYQGISITQDGQLFWGTEPVDLDTLSRNLELLSAQPNPPVLNIRADARLPYQRVIEVIDLIKQNQLDKISLDTQVR